MPVRMTENMFEEFAARVGPAAISGEPSRGGKASRPKKRKEALPENQVEALVVDFLRLRGWVVEKTHVGVYVPWYSLEALWRKGIAIVKGVLAGGTVTRIGTKGDPDYRAWRPRSNGGVDLFLVEVKAPGKRPSPDQVSRIRELRLTGAVVEWFDDFDFGGPHSFVEFYTRQFAQEG